MCPILLLIESRKFDETTGNVHAVHHKLYTPYAFGALYNHWAESTFSDGIGGILGVTIMRLTALEQIVFTAAITAKTVEDHAGYELPWSPFTLFAQLTGAGPEYHTIHHQTWGLKVSHRRLDTFHSLGRFSI